MSPMLRERMHYDADPATVYAMLTDRAFQEEAMAATGSQQGEVSIEEGEGAARRVTTRRALPTADAPDVVRRFVGDRVVVTQVTTWGPAAPDGTRTATTEADIEGVPASAAGTMRLEPAGGGTDHVVEVALTSKVPLVGGRIVAAAEPLVGRAIAAEHRAGVRHLEQTR